MEWIVELLKISVPAIIVAWVVRTMMMQHYKQQREEMRLQLLQKGLEQTLPLRLQSYERLALCLDRIRLHALSTRYNTTKLDPKDQIPVLMLGVQQEIEHNIVQQLYVSDQLWNIIQITRNEVMHQISQLSEPDSNSANTEVRFQKAAEAADRFIDSSLTAIKTEINTLLR